MSVYERIDEMSERLTQGEPRHISNRIGLYSEGVKAKLKNAEYALIKIKELKATLYIIPPENYADNDCRLFSYMGGWRLTP